MNNKNRKIARGILSSILKKNRSDEINEKIQFPCLRVKGHEYHFVKRAGDNGFYQLGEYVCKKCGKLRNFAISRLSSYNFALTE